MKLYGYFRSGAAYRVRIALALKGISVEQRSIHLRKGDQKGAEFLAMNPQGLVPALITDEGEVLTQSLAIIHWLEAKVPDPALLPADPLRRARVEAFAYAIACDTHPVQNLGVLKKLKSMGHSDEETNAWAAAVNREGLSACESLIAGEKGPFCFGDSPSLADVCLVPQMANARRFGADIAGLKRILEAEAACKTHPAFIAASPEKQPDFEG